MYDWDCIENSYSGGAIYECRSSFNPSSNQHWVGRLNKTPLVRHPYLLIFIVVVTIFLLGANRAWISHRAVDGGYFVYKVQNTIDYPFMWQYNLDALEEFEAAQFFPSRYKFKASLISRPLLQMSVNLFARSVQFLINPILLSDSVKKWMVDKSLISPSAPSLEKILFTLYILQVVRCG